MFAHFVEFKTFTITVPVCPLNWIFLYFFHFQTFSNKSLIKTLSNKLEFQLKDTSSEIWMKTCQFTIKYNLTTVALEYCADVQDNQNV